MALNIKNRETEQLARQLVQRTGESMTAAVTTAVRERLERLEAPLPGEDADERAERIAALGRDIASRLHGELAERDHGDVLYDEAGLPA